MEQFDSVDKNNFAYLYESIDADEAGMYTEDEMPPLMDNDNDDDGYWSSDYAIEGCDYHRHFSVQSRNYLGSTT